MAKTRKPCPSCKEVYPWQRDADDICPNCQNDRKRLEYLEAEFSKINSETVQVYYQAAPHWNQYFYSHCGADTGELQKAFYALAESIVVPYTGDYQEGGISLMGPGSGGGFRSGRRGLLRKDIAEAFIKLHQSIQPLLDAVHEDSFKQGHNLLMRLAAGDLSPNEYMKKSS